MSTRPYAQITFIATLLAALAACGPKVPGPEQNLPPLSVEPFAGLDALEADQPQPFTFRKGPAPPPQVSEKLDMPFPPPLRPTSLGLSGPSSPSRSCTAPNSDLRQPTGGW